jgi:hypothetical protein
MGAWEHPVIVGRAERADAEAILSTVTDPKAIAGTLQVPYPSVEMWRKRVAELPPDNYFLAATVAGEVVGSRGLHRAAKSPRRRHAGNLGVTVRDDRHGRGVDTHRRTPRSSLPTVGAISRESPYTADLASRWNGHAAGPRS